MLECKGVGNSQWSEESPEKSASATEPFRFMLDVVGVYLHHMHVDVLPQYHSVLAFFPLSTFLILCSYRILDLPPG